MEREVKGIKTFVDEVTLKVYDNYLHVKDEQLLDFYKYFEDIIISEMLTKGSPIRAYNNNGKVSGNLLSSLIASRLKKDGEEVKEPYANLYIYHSRDNFVYAKEKILENEMLYLNDYDYGHKLATVYSKVKASDEPINPTELVKIATTMQDRLNGYNELAKNTKVYLETTKELWNEEQRKYIRDGLTDKPYYKILEDLFDFKKQQQHYPLVTREALEKVSSLTYKLDRDLNVTMDDLQDMYRFNAASTAIGSNVALKYNDEIKEVMREYTIRHKAKQIKIG